jgi:hypothetical protein
MCAGGLGNVALPGRLQSWHGNSFTSNTSFVVLASPPDLGSVVDRGAQAGRANTLTQACTSSHLRSVYRALAAKYPHPPPEGGAGTPHEVAAGMGMEEPEYDHQDEDACRYLGHVLALKAAALAGDAQAGGWVRGWQTAYLRQAWGLGWSRCSCAWLECVAVVLISSALTGLDRTQRRLHDRPSGS